ncbi:hypothetical protein [Roseateles amylovorans]|uniref:Uncharacterized protein n=1 Tax=Roseateles amylovorans TaxID=2978473 RepID=A0ABY6AWZ8_9BURK|nr:hypothetical protein [Roseateles amylovorans]UXH76294.1 hypothetical protein N4261_14595 [Roseateles amylovorans]
MTPSLLQTLPVFAPAFVRALGTNLSLAADALALGFPVGVLLGMLCLPARTPDDTTVWRRLGARGAAAALALMRAAPAFVVMFVLLNALPTRWEVSAGGAVALSLAVYAAAFVADTALVAVMDWRSGARGGAVLFVLGLARAYFVMVLSSGFGAAIGVTEATAVTLRTLERLGTTSDRLLLIGGVVLVFVALRQSLYAAIFVVRRLVETHLLRDRAG